MSTDAQQNSNTSCAPGPLPGDPELLEPLLTIEQLSKSFRTNDGNTLLVLKDLSLTIRNIKSKPQIVSLLGPSGAGKTTALRIIAGLDKPTSGCVLLSEGEGKPLRESRVGDVGVVFQRYPLFDDINVMNNLIEPAVRAGMSKQEARDKALRLLDEFDMVKQGLAWPQQLSGGQRQRVAILQQLMQDRHFIILDEPFSGLDPVNIINVIDLIVGTANQHTLNTFIIVTHDVTSALIVSDTVFLLGRGRDEKDNPIPGARVMKQYDLIGEGLAYHPDIEDLPRFSEIRKEIKLVEFPRL
ncbi:MAG TPA: ATP-binding cassette domain-containing protein [Pyrinomonadaceae bacterium]|jgi:ABC-type nitrate/sulfonate/bicarbonate transport system ATPase subunit